MKTEAIIKQQAREALRGNLSNLLAAAGLTALAAAGLTALVMLLLEYLEYLAASFLGSTETDAGSVLLSQNWHLIPLMVVYTALVLLAAPLVNGFVRMAVSVAVRKTCEPLDVLYYFRDRRLYFKTVLVDLLLYVLYAAASGALDLHGYLALALPNVFDAAPGLTVEGFATVFMQVLTGVIRVLVFMLLAHYPLLSYAFDDEQGVIQCVFVTIGFSFRHFWQLFRLVLSMAGWLLLCFFVVPVLYVLPYFAVAAAMSARWLFELDADGVAA